MKTNIYKISTTIIIKSSLSIFILGFWGLSLKAQTKQYSGNTVISGKIYDKKDLYGHVRIEYYKNYSEQWEGRYNIPFKLDIKDGNFNLQTKQIKTIGYIKLIVNDREDRVQYLLNGPYIIEPNDKIIIKIRKGVPIFYGKRAEKYNLTYQLNKIKFKIFNSVPQGDLTYPWKMKQIDSLYKVKLALLNSHRGTLSKNLYRIFELNLRSENVLTKANFLYNCALTDSHPDKIKYLDLYYTFIKPDLPNNPDTWVALKSLTYVDCLYMIENLKSFLSPDVLTKAAVYPRSFRLIVKNYSGPIKDKLLACKFSNFPTRADSVAILRNEALGLVKSNSDFYRIIDDNRVRFAKGEKVFDFHLVDSLNNVRTLNEFKDKVVVMEFYFNGCTGCRILSQAMSPVINKYKNNMDVKFISVNVDATKKLFIDAVKKGIYTHNESINLWTGTSAMKNDLIKYYGFDSFPKLLLIDRDGKILDENYLRPGLNRQTLEPDPNNQGVLQMIQIIENGLAKKN